MLQQRIKIIAENVLNMSIIARIKFSKKLKDSTSEIGYYSYTKRYQPLKIQTKEFTK